VIGTQARQIADLSRGSFASLIGRGEVNAFQTPQERWKEAGDMWMFSEAGR
jgi:hypothetical protein